MQDQSPASRQPDILASAPRCGARTRSGAPCRSPAVGGRRRCRMHGGARGSGAPRGNRHAWKHGLRSAAYRDTARYIRASSRFLAAARLALRASALGPDIAGLAWRQAAAVWAAMPAIPRACAPVAPPRPSAAQRLTGAAAPHPSWPRVAPEKEKTNEQPHAPGYPAMAEPAKHPAIAVANAGAGPRSGPDAVRLARRRPPSPPARSRYRPLPRPQADGAAARARPRGGTAPAPNPRTSPSPMTPSGPMTMMAAAR